MNKTVNIILTTLIIDAHEERDVAAADVPGAYLHAEFPKEKKVILKLTGVFVDIMCSVNPEYTKYVIYEVNKRGKDPSIFMYESCRPCTVVSNLHYFGTSCIPPHFKTWVLYLIHMINVWRISSSMGNNAQ